MAARPQDPPRVSALRWPVRIAPYPTLLAVAYVLEPSIGADVSPLALTRVLVFVVAVGLLATIAWSAALGRERGAAAAMVSIAGLAVASNPLRIGVFVAALALLCVEWWSARTGRMQIRIGWSGLTSFFNAALAILVAIQVGGAAYTRLGVPTVPAATGWTPGQDPDTPNIYVLLADGHGRRDVLADALGMDSTAFAAALTALGFTESPNSHANHARTLYSLSVLFNGRPLSELGQDPTAPVDDRIASQGLAHASVFELLRSLGYEVEIIGSGYEQVALRDAGTYVDVGPRNEVEGMLLGSTAIGEVINGLTGGSSEATRQRTLAEIVALESSPRASSSRPRFVFMHLPVPHLPFVFEDDCSARTDDHYTNGQSGGYRAGDVPPLGVDATQTRCVDTLLIDAARTLVAADPTAVIVILSDHGVEDHLDWWNPSAQAIADRMANLFWARTPGQPGLFPADISLVNVFPILFNAYVGSDIALHPNDLLFGPLAGVNRLVPYAPSDP
jgi:Sulfatase